MMKSRDLLAGLFVLFGIAFLIFGIAWSDKLLGIFDGRREVSVLLPRGVPIEVGQAVRMEGIRIGEVTGYRVRNQKERGHAHEEYHLSLLLRVDPEVPLGRNTEVVLTGDGLLGARYLQLRTPDGELEAWDGEEPLLAKLGGVDYFLEGMREMSDSLNGLLRGLERMVGTETQEGSLLAVVDGIGKRLDPILASAAETMKKVQEGVDSLRPDLRRVLRESGNLLAELNTIVAENRDDLPKLLGAAERTLQQLQSSLERVESATTTLLEEARAPLVTMQKTLERNDRNLFLLLHNLRVATQEMKVGLARLFADPSQLLFGGSSDPEAAAEAVKRSLERDLLDHRRLPARSKR